MKNAQKVIVLITFIALLHACALFKSPNVPGWYKKNYTASEYVYGKGRGSSQREELAVKKAETAAQSELSAQADIELGKIITHLMDSKEIRKNEFNSERYQVVRKNVLLELQQMVRIKKKEIIHDNSIFKAFYLLELDKSELRKLYLYTLKSN